MQFIGNRYDILDYNGEIEVGKLYKARDAYSNNIVYVKLINNSELIKETFKPDLIDESTVRLISVPVPNYNGLWFDGKNLYSNRVIRKDKKFIKCKLQNLTCPTPRYKVSKNKYMSIASLRELCGFSELE